MCACINLRQRIFSWCYFMFLLCSSKLKRDVSGRKNLGWNTQATSFISEHGSEGCECDTLTSLISFDIFNNLAWMFSAAPAPAHSLCFDYSPDPGSLVSLVKWLSFQPSKLTLWECKIFRTFSLQLFFFLILEAGTTFSFTVHLVGFFHFCGMPRTSPTWYFTEWVYLLLKFDPKTLHLFVCSPAASSSWLWQTEGYCCGDHSPLGMSRPLWEHSDFSKCFWRTDPKG